MISHQIPQMPLEVADLYMVRGTYGAALDNGGEPCEWCQTEGNTIDAQTYTTSRDGDNVFIESCRTCVPRALELEDVAPGTIIEVEYSA